VHNELRDAVVVEVTSRMMAACVRHAEVDDSVQLDVLINDTLYHEKKRLEGHKSAPNWAGDLAFWDQIKGRLVHADEGEQRMLLEQIVQRFVHEILGNFSPLVYEASTKLMPTALPLLLNALSPKKLLSGGIPDLRDSVRIRGRLDGLRRCQELGTVILAPTHVSNLDSVLIGWALYALGLPPFTYGAGLNLFSNPVLSFFMRNLGAYRVDRTKTSPLYKDTLKTYATVCLEHGQSQLFFPGGTRSRSGEVEGHIKLGLMSCGLRAYVNNLMARRERPNVYIVPCNLNFHLVLEASTLIEDHLRLVGKSRYIITDDESFRPKEVLRFLSKLMQMESEIVLNIGDPLDPFGNRVNDEGQSVDGRGREVDITRYVTDDEGHTVHDPQRDRVYTRQAGQAVAAAFRRHNSVVSTNLLAFTMFQMMRQAHASLDLYRLLRTAGDGAGFLMGEVADSLHRVMTRVRELVAQGQLEMSDEVARGEPTRIIQEALRHFGSYHRGGVISRRGDRIFANDMNLVYYYHNRLSGYDLESALDGGRAR
jgi:glycerol-3-phosphate O-acyltransferase